MNNRKSISFTAFMLALLAVVMLTCNGCSPTVYWGRYVHTASGKHYKQVPGWGDRTGCEAMHHGQYIKESAVRRYRFN
jgi:hypothetical protein